MGIIFPSSIWTSTSTLTIIFTNKIDGISPVKTSSFFNKKTAMIAVFMAYEAQVVKQLPNNFEYRRFHAKSPPPFLAEIGKLL